MHIFFIVPWYGLVTVDIIHIFQGYVAQLYDCLCSGEMTKETCS